MNPFDIPGEELEQAGSTKPLYSNASEQAVLSMLATFPDCFDGVADTLHADCFADSDNRKIFAEIAKQIAAGKGLDQVSVMQALMGEIEPEHVMAVLSCNDFSARGLRRHVETLTDLHQSRQLHAVSFKIAELAFGEGAASERIDQAQAAIQALEVQGGEDEWVDAYTAAVAHTEVIDARERGEITGLATGYADLDQMLDGGPVRGNLVVIGARPAMGKTALAMSIGLSMASDLTVGFVSLEMPHSDVRDRQTAILGKLSIGDIKRPKRGNGLDYTRVVDAVERSKYLNWFVTAKSSMNIQQLRSMARKLKRTKGLDVLIVDYIGLMSGIPGKNYGASKVYEVQDITIGLKSLAKELDIAVLALAQVGRGADPKKPPTLRDLRDSGSIEQDADIVAFIHRPIQENPDLGERFKNYALLRVAKNRQGPTGDVHLFYRGEITGFEGWAGPAPTVAVAAPLPEPKGRYSRGMD
jgi:replicative DNA helicase